MDPYSLKRDNRKKFQDKQRLKHRHATPSDRKYRALNNQEKQKEQPREDNDDKNEGGEDEEEPSLPPSNEHRYHEDISMAFENLLDAERDSIANRKVKEILRAKEKEDPHQDLLQSTTNKNEVTTKNLNAMDLNALNDLLGVEKDTFSTRKNQPIKASPPPTKETTSGSTPKPVPKKTATATDSLIPSDLVVEQDFLDELL